MQVALRRGQSLLLESRAERRDDVQHDTTKYLLVDPQAAD